MKIKIRFYSLLFLTQKITSIIAIKKGVDSDFVLYIMVITLYG